MRIKKLDIFVTKQFAMLFVGTFFISQFVLMMQFLWRFVDELIGKGLSMEVLAQFFWYMGLILVPQALPLAILLSSLITFGNLGESSELTAIKAAGISLMQAFRPLIVIVAFVSAGSFYFQNVVAPSANMSFGQLLLSMKQKSPELEIPEGVFYDGIPESNIYVQKKDIKTGSLYGIMIYRMTQSYEDAAIILADSGMLQSTADKKHLLLTLHSGEWFENMRSQDVVGNSNGVPYRRETFADKRIVLDFDADFNMADAGGFSNNAKTKSLEEITYDLDSLKHNSDSTGRVFYQDISRSMNLVTKLQKKDETQAKNALKNKAVQVDSAYARLASDKRISVVNAAQNAVQMQMSDLEFKGMITADNDKQIRLHEIERINKFTMALVCLIFFFIGAPLGAIIRKGGLGVPVIVSVLVFIFYYILDNTGYRMARGGMWAVWFGKSLATAVLLPIAVFFTYKANNDSVVFNIDLYKQFFMNLLGIRPKRHVFFKEVIIDNPDYAVDREKLGRITGEVEQYAREHNLLHAPNMIRVFFKYTDDFKIKTLSDELEGIIEDLANTKDRVIMSALNHYPFITTKSHKRPFDKKWQNIIAAVLVPVGLFLFFRMWHFRLQLYRDLKMVKETNNIILRRIGEMK